MTAAARISGRRRGGRIPLRGLLPSPLPPGRTPSPIPDGGSSTRRAFGHGLYGAAYGERFRANAYAGAAGNHFSTKRTINFADIARTATADPRGSDLNLHTDAAYALWQERWGNISPAVGLDYDRFREGAFTENGADSLDLSMQPQTETSLRSNLKIEYAAEAIMSAYKLGTKLSAGWRHEFDASQAVASQLATGTGTTLSVSPLDFGKDGFLLGLGVYCDLGKTFSIQIDYAGDYSARVTGSTVRRRRSPEVLTAAGGRPVPSKAAPTPHSKSAVHAPWASPKRHFSGPTSV